MLDLAWNWWCLPYLVAAVLMAAVGIAAAVIRGDRVLRIGVVGAVVSSIPWATTSAIEACTRDPKSALIMLRLGNGSVALVGPCILLVLLGASGQLERQRWLARAAGVVGTTLMIVCWTTDLTISNVHPVGGGLLYMTAGPLTGFHVSQLGLWAAFGLYLARRSAVGSDRRRLIRLLIMMLALGAVGASDVRLAYGASGVPLAWGPVLAACGLAFYLVTRTDLLRPRGLDRDVIIEVVGFSLASLAVGGVVYASREASPIVLAALGGLAWVIAMGIAWSIARRRPVRVVGERALTRFVAEVGEITEASRIARGLDALWRRAIGIELRATWATDSEGLTEVVPIPAAGDPALANRVRTRTRNRWKLSPELASWLVGYGEPFATSDLATMRLGDLRTQLESFASAHGATLLIPLVDRDTLVGLVEATYDRALRENERRLVIESARAAARALTYVGLADAAAREGATAREVELAQAMRLQAVRRDDELGRWRIGAEYRSAARTTGAGWSAVALADGRLAVLVTEAQAHGVAAALATAALTGAFTALTAGDAKPTLDSLLADLRATGDGVIRGGEPVAAFLALLDADGAAVEWACAGHPGGYLLAGNGAPPIVLGRSRRAATGVTGLTSSPGVTGATAVVLRGHTPLAGATLVVASTGLRGDDRERWANELATLPTTGPRLAAQLVAGAARADSPDEDLLAVVVRDRA